MTPAFWLSQCSCLASERNLVTAGLIVVRSERSTERKCRWPLESGCLVWMSLIQASALDKERPAIQTVALC